MITAHWMGLKEAQETIRSMGDAFAEPVLEAALKRTAKPFEEDLARRIPRASGLTADDVRTVSSKGEGAAQALVGARVTKGGRAFILRFLERGTAHTPQQASVRPAWDANKDAWGKNLLAELSLQYQRHVKKFAKKARAA